MISRRNVKCLTNSNSKSANDGITPHRGPEGRWWKDENTWLLHSRCISPTILLFTSYTNKLPISWEIAHSRFPADYQNESNYCNPQECVAFPERCTLLTLPVHVPLEAATVCVPHTELQRTTWSQTPVACQSGRLWGHWILSRMACGNWCKLKSNPWRQHSR